jgi:hypothetical protein
VLTFSKTRCRELQGRSFRDPGTDVAQIIKVWLDTGEEDRKLAIHHVKEAWTNAATEAGMLSETPTSAQSATLKEILGDLYDGLAGAEDLEATEEQGLALIRAWERPKAEAPAEGRRRRVP